MKAENKRQDVFPMKNKFHQTAKSKGLKEVFFKLSFLKIFSDFFGLVPLRSKLQKNAYFIPCQMGELKGYFEERLLSIILRTCGFLQRKAVLRPVDNGERIYVSGMGIEALRGIGGRISKLWRSFVEKVSGRHGFRGEQEEYAYDLRSEGVVRIGVLGIGEDGREVVRVLGEEWVSLRPVGKRVREYEYEVEGEHGKVKVVERL